MTFMDQAELITLETRAREFLSLDVREDQRGFVATVAESYADALFPPEDESGPPLVWIRGIVRAGAPAGYVMCADPTEMQKDPWLWRLLVDNSHQGLGLGRFAVESVLARYKEMGCTRVFVSWVPKDGNASGFYKKLGFSETGEIKYDEVVAEYRF